MWLPGLEWVNWWAEQVDQVGRDGVEAFAKILAPMAPFISETIYQQLRGESDSWESVHATSWPQVEGGEYEGERVTVKLGGRYFWMWGRVHVARLAGTFEAGNLKLGLLLRAALRPEA